MDEKPEGNTAEKAQGCFLCETAIPLLERCLGGDTMEHFRNSRIEFLKGMRSLLDERIAHLSKQTEHKGTHVTVE
ncbi:MAG TPA: hypothetical protein VHW09_22405 [Bryobacteraceae bacterium]|jgi:hypothetical protein|nr:hypothetical protein [Bryobacteraceae bacterium]